MLYLGFSSVACSTYYILDDVYVTPMFRRQGSAKQLIDTAILFAKQENALRISLETQTNNHESHRLYEKWDLFETVNFRHSIAFLNNILSELLFLLRQIYPIPFLNFR